MKEKELNKGGITAEKPRKKIIINYKNNKIINRNILKIDSKHNNTQNKTE